jgi:hypothetical protein
MKKIAIFNLGYELLGYIDENFTFYPFTKDEVKSGLAKKIISQINKEKLTLRDGTEVSINNPLFLIAISEELNRNGLITKTIESNLQPLLDQIFTNFRIEEIYDFIGDIINTETDDTSMGELEDLINKIIQQKYE